MNNAEKMRRISSAPNLSPSSSTSAPLAASRRSTSIASGLADMVSTADRFIQDAQVEAVVNAPITNLAVCTESYGFPTEVLEVHDAERAKDMAVCLATPDDFGENEVALVARRNPLTGAMYTSTEIEQRYNRFLEVRLRRRRK